MVCITHRVRSIASIAGSARLRQLDDILRTEPHVTRALLEGGARRVADALMRICARIEMESESHAQRLAHGMRLLGTELGLGADRLAHLELGAFVHDVGKMAVPDSILKSPAVLGPSELDLIKMHCSLGHAVLFGLPGLERAAELVLHHHEYWDGTGYSEARRGHEIPEDARIFAVVDSYEAMVRLDRSFRVGVAHESARHEVLSLAGVRYDPDIVAAFARIPRGAWEAVWERWPDDVVAVGRAA